MHQRAYVMRRRSGQKDCTVRRTALPELGRASCDKERVPCAQRETGLE